MSESRRVTSTARSIQRSWLWRLFKLYFWLDLLLAILAIGCFCFYEELSALGGAWTPGLERTVEMGAQGGFFQRVWDAVYIFYGPDGEMYAVAAKPFFNAALPAAFALLVFEFLSLSRQLFFGGRRARRLLRPLDEMARAYYKAPNSVCIEQGVDWREGICRENKVDGVLVHYNRSCKPWSGYMAEMQRRFTEDLGVPCAGFDGDQADPRNFNAAQYETRVQGLVEAMDANKQAKEA